MPRKAKEEIIEEKKNGFKKKLILKLLRALKLLKLLKLPKLLLKQLLQKRKLAVLKKQPLLLLGKLVLRKPLPKNHQLKRNLLLNITIYQTYIIKQL